MLLKISFLITCLAFQAFAQGADLVVKTDINDVASPTSAKLNRTRGLNMLSEIEKVLKERYYDKDFRGIKLEERFDLAAQKIKKLDTNAQIFRVIAAVVLELKDSHTTFYPPGRANRVEYGFSMQMIGNDCYVIDVKKGSDAEKKGLKIGDVILGIGKYEITRDSLWMMNYSLYQLDPQEQLKVYVLNPDNTEREIVIDATFKPLGERLKESEKRSNEKRENPYKCQKINSEVIACQLKTFSVDKKYIDQMMAEVAPFKKFILDLRGNGGGYVKIEEYLTGHFFDRDVKIATFVMRDKTKERVAKPQRARAFAGDLIVLIDSHSASASEVFSRVMQIEKRAKVVGDVSAGAVMTSIQGTMANARGVPGYETISLYGISVTIADLIMSDGNRLEGVGVMPDHPVGPSGKAMADRSDPVLAYAAKLFGAELSPQDAGKFYFINKKEENEAEEKAGDEDN